MGALLASPAPMAGMSITLPKGVPPASAPNRQAIPPSCASTPAGRIACTELGGVLWVVTITSPSGCRARPLMFAPTACCQRNRVAFREVALTFRLAFEPPPAVRALSVAVTTRERLPAGTVLVPGGPFARASPVWNAPLVGSLRETVKSIAQEIVPGTQIEC